MHNFPEEKMPAVRLNITIDDKIEKRFREVVGEVYGYKKGVLQEAIETAVKEWMERHETKAKTHKT